MSDTPGPSTPKAIGSLVRKQSDVTRQGSQKLKFIPTLPQRRKKEDIKQVFASELVQSRCDAKGRGRGRGAPPVLEMTASGPFAMGPSQGSNNARKTGLQPVDWKAKDVKVEGEEVYSDPEDGVEIVDMDQVRHMDWMAPEVLRREQRSDHPKVVREERDDNLENFTNQELGSQDQLYLFQLPSPFPHFVSKSVVDLHQQPVTVGKKVAFAADIKSDDVKPRMPSIVPESSKTEGLQSVDGLIGHLEVYKSGAVKMRLANDILLDVNSGTQPSFLQHVVHLDKAKKQLVILGEVNKQFIVSPNIDALLSALDKQDSDLHNSSLRGENSMQA